MSRKKEMDMLNGSISDKILIFALPLAASGILQQLFNSADVAVVGRYAGSAPLAAVGSTGSVIGLLVNLFVGLSIGANVTAAKYLGQQNKEAVKKTVHTSMLLAFFSGIVLFVLGQIVIKLILRLMSTPEDVMPLAVTYMRIYFFGMPFTMVYNFGSALLRSIGDTKRPMLCLIASGVINVLLNLFFVIVCGLGVSGVAIATVVSNIISSALIVVFLIREKSAVHLEVRELKIYPNILKEVSRIGVPAGVQGMVFSFSNVCIQGALNSFGSTVVAGSSVALNFETYTYYLLNAFGQTCTTFVSQNMGAGNLKRCAAVVKRTALMCAVFVFALSALFIIFDTAFLSIFTTDAEVMRYGVIRMHTILWFQAINGMIEVFSGAMRGMGKALTPTVITVVGVCGLRLGYVFIFNTFSLFSSLSSLLAVYPISWITTALAITTAFCITYGKQAKKLGEASR